LLVGIIIHRAGERQNALFAGLHAVEILGVYAIGHNFVIAFWTSVAKLVRIIGRANQADVHLLADLALDLLKKPSFAGKCPQAQRIRPLTSDLSGHGRKAIVSVEYLCLRPMASEDKRSGVKLVEMDCIE
jgi:hypothetical protein